MFDIIHTKPPQALGKRLTNGSHQICSREILACARVPNLHACRRPKCPPKGPNFGFGSHPCSQRATQWCQKNSLENERQAVGCCATHKRARGREKREKECAVLIMKKSSGSSFQNLQGTNKLRLVKEWCRCCSSSKKRKHNCASPSDDNLFYDWGFVFFFVFFFVCAVFCSRLFAFARKQRK